MTARLLHRLKIALLGLLAAGGLALAPVAVAGAQDIIDNGGVCSRNPDATLCKENQDENIDSNRIFGPDGIITKAARLITVVVGVASIVMIMSSGIQYIIATGDPARLNRAKDTLLYALIGVAIAISAQAIIVFVLNNIG